MQFLSKAYMTLLLLGAIGMLIWGLAGFFEYFIGIVPVIGLQNAAYPSGVQFMHWLLISISGGVFLLGYIARWKWTPITMILVYSNLAVLCTIETFDFMSGQWGYPQFFMEIGLYVIHSLFLLLSPISKSHFRFNQISS
ncbi:hypothetical protein QQ008_07910 [Fulvivirgaceae bacterium BMA10]|uniref:DUF4345 domain-containing protein n=1 Tax=Splendidivirga corallicola TaxID=3051826 RepID=A0ABT8KKN9_9BACT|nr:hypothetical protein [Fulvivirgaceae bacterium BMA10]